MGKVTFKPGYQDLGPYPLLQPIINAGGLEAEGGLNTTLTDPLTLTNVNGNTLLIGNTVNDGNNFFISTKQGDDYVTGISSIFLDSTPIRVNGISIATNSVTGNSATALEVIGEYLGDIYYKSFNMYTDGTTGDSGMYMYFFKNGGPASAFIGFDDSTTDALINLRDNGGYYRENLQTFQTGVGTIFLAIKTNGTIETLLPEYASDVAADTDTTLPTGGLYTLTGDRTVYRKP